MYSSKDILKFADFSIKLLAKYEIRVLKDIKNFLNIRIFKEKTFRRLYLAFNTFIKKITNKFHILITDKPFKTLLLPYINLSVYIG